jgi:hypothetical protein
MATPFLAKLAGGIGSLASFLTRHRDVGLGRQADFSQFVQRSNAYGRVRFRFSSGWENVESPSYFNGLMNGLVPRGGVRQSSRIKRLRFPTRRKGFIEL